MAASSTKCSITLKGYGDDVNLIFRQLTKLAAIYYKNVTLPFKASPFRGSKVDGLNL
jgi:hypothetical protein